MACNICKTLLELVAEPAVDVQNVLSGVEEIASTPQPRVPETVGYEENCVVVFSPYNKQMPLGSLIFVTIVAVAVVSGAVVVFHVHELQS